MPEARADGGRPPGSGGRQRPGHGRWQVWAVWALVAAEAAAIFALSASSRPPGSSALAGLLPLDKLAHLSEYAVLGGTLLLAFRLSFPYKGWEIAAASAAAAVAYGGTDELHQAFVPGRSCDLADLLADGMGGTLGALVAWASVRRRRAHARARGRRRA